MSEPAVGDAAVRQATLHALGRWLGVGFFITGLLLLGGSLTSLVLGHGQIGDVMVAVFGCGLSLGTFGSHNDTALAMLRDNRWHPAIPAKLVRELDQEFLFQRLVLSEISPTPRMSWAMTILAPLVLLWALLCLVL